MFFFVSKIRKHTVFVIFIIAQLNLIRHHNFRFFRILNTIGHRNFGLFRFFRNLNRFGIPRVIGLFDNFCCFCNNGCLDRFGQCRFLQNNWDRFRFWCGTFRHRCGSFHDWCSTFRNWFRRFRQNRFWLRFDYRSGYNWDTFFITFFGLPDNGVIRLRAELEKLGQIQYSGVRITHEASNFLA